MKTFTETNILHAFRNLKKPKANVFSRSNENARTNTVKIRFSLHALSAFNVHAERTQILIVRIEFVRRETFWHQTHSMLVNFMYFDCDTQYYCLLPSLPGPIYGQSIRMKFYRDDYSVILHGYFTYG